MKAKLVGDEQNKKSLPFLHLNDRSKQVEDQIQSSCLRTSWSNNFDPVRQEDCTKFVCIYSPW